MNQKNEQIKKLRDMTGYSVVECKKAFEQTGDIKKASKLLQKQGVMISSKREDKQTSSGIIDCYIHSDNRIAATVEMSCETDFVARNKDFREFVHSIVMQIAAMNPKNITELMEQPFIKDETIRISDLLSEITAKTGEKIEIRRFIRFELGKE